MSEYDDYQLDAETLRQIEEEAMREAQAEIGRDEDWGALERQALLDAGLDESEITDDLIAEMKREADTLTDDELDFDFDDLDFDESELDKHLDLDLDADFDEPAPVPAAPTAPTAPTAPAETAEDAEDEAIKQAKAQARRSAKKKAAAKRKAAAAQVIKHRDPAAPPSRGSLEMMEREIEKKSGMFKVALIAVIAVIVLGAVGVFMIIQRNKKRAEDPGTSTKAGTPTSTKKPGNAEKTREAKVLFSKIRQMAGRKRIVAGHIEEGLEMLAKLKKEHPDYCKENQQAIDNAEKTLKDKQERLRNMMNMGK